MHNCTVGYSSMFVPSLPLLAIHNVKVKRAAGSQRREERGDIFRNINECENVLQNRPPFLPPRQLFLAFLQKIKKRVLEKRR